MKTSKMSIRKDYYILLAIATAVAAVDQITKLIVANTITQGTIIPIIERFFYLVHTTNTGVAWGMLEGQRALLIGITLFAFVLFGYIAKDIDYKSKKFLSFGIALMIGGAIGNFIDRVITGAVVDFLDFYIFSYNFPVFNVADIALTIGMACFALDVLILESKRESMNNA